ncbi:MAG: TonB-dependent receptor, partial [Gammaproteobacteria bacterium]
MTLRILCASTLLAFSAVTPSLAQAAIKHQIDIPAQQLSSALAALAQQARIQLLYPTELVVGQQARSLSGSMTPEDALRVLLEQSRLRFEFLDAQTVTLLPSSGPAQSATTPNEAAPIAPIAPRPVTWSGINRGPIRLAQSNDVHAASGAGDEGRVGAATSAASAVEQIVVTGSRIGAKGVSAAPVVTFTREKLDELGVTQIADVLNYLPQQSFQVLEGDTFAGARPVQLRGLGLGTTLVLVNGRRTVTAALQGARAFFDLSMLPLAAVERIEVLADSASAIYGADAIGGVLNVVLKDHVDHPTLDLQVSNIQDGGGERQASFTVGASGERFKSMLVLDFLKRDALYGYQRDFTSNMDYRRFGGLDMRSPRRNPGNVCSIDGTNLPGLPTSCAGVPVGSTGVGLTPADFLATAGVLNLGSPYDYWSLVPSGRRASGYASGEFAFTNEVTGFGELMYMDRVDTRMDTIPSLYAATVPASNPYNPFGIPVSVNYRMDADAYGNRDEPSNTEAWRAVTGVTGTYEKWSWEVSALYANESADNTTHNALDTGKALASLAQTDPALALNLFSDGPAGSAALLDSIKAPGQLDTFKSQMLQLSQFVRRSLLSMPAGELKAVLGAEERREKLAFNSIYLAYPLAVDRDVTSGFVEFRVPLLGGDYTKPWAKELTFTTSARYDDYNDIGGTFNPQFGLV